MSKSTAATLGYVILYVDDIDRACKFYVSAFQLKERMRHGESYAELDTGAVTLAFAQRSFVVEHLGLDPGRANGSAEVAFVVPKQDVKSIFDGALRLGATSAVEPRDQPWGQRVSYIRDPEGHLVEICSPASG